MSNLAESQAFRRRQERRAINEGTHPDIVARRAISEKVQTTEYIMHLRERLIKGVHFPLDIEEAIKFLSNQFTTSDGIISELHPFYLREFHSRGHTREDRRTVASEEELVHLGFGRLALSSHIPDPSRPDKYIPWSKVSSKTIELEERYDGENIGSATPNGTSHDNKGIKEEAR